MNQRLNEEQALKNAHLLVRKYLGNDTTGHDSLHIERVVALAKYLAKFEDDVNLFVIELAALLHDIEDVKLNHAGSGVVQRFLDENDIPIDERNQIIDIIDNLSYSSTLKGKIERTKEGQIVQDADRLDALGAIGIARTFAFGGAKGRMIEGSESATLHHFEEKLLKLEGLMNTREGKRLARKRTEYIQNFLKQYDSEKNIRD